MTKEQAMLKLCGVEMWLIRQKHLMIDAGLHGTLEYRRILRSIEDLQTCQNAILEIIEEDGYDTECD